MTISGGIKFFEPNLADSKTGATVTASTGQPAAPFILDRNKYTFWRSVGSDDLTVETLEITLDSSQAISRLFLVNHNFKTLQALWWDGGGWVEFQNVTGINSVESAVIIEAAYALNTAYYEFDEVTTDKIIITTKETQTPDQEKFLNSFIVTNELGTLQGFPNIKDATKDKKLRKSTMLNGRSFIDKSLEVIRFTVDFKNYPAPTPYADDLDLVYSIFDRDENFLVWLCGGRNGDPYFKYQLRGFRIEDIIEVQTVNIFKDSYRSNYYNGTVKLMLKLEEAV
jgi:hypothetical protein